MILHTTGLGSRLEQLYSMTYQHITRSTHGDHSIWDLCCDHGKLGMALASKLEHNQSLAKVVFVDRIGHITQALHTKISSKKVSEEKYHVVTADVNNPSQFLQLSDLQSSNSCMIMAGVGAHLISKFLYELVRIFPILEIKATFIVSAHKHQFWLRQQLYNLSATITNECLVVEREQFYQHLVVNFASDSNRCMEQQLYQQLWGFRSNGIWNHPQSLLYWQKTYRHFQKKNDQKSLESLDKVALDQGFKE